MVIQNSPIHQSATEVILGYLDGEAHPVVTIVKSIGHIFFKLKVIYDFTMII